ncbi:MAG: type II toxin-antitoxin system RelE/ParE family toxin [Cyanobacteria bacterium P01_C01_bin.38]
MREVIFYRTNLDKCPIEEFLDSLTAKQAQKVSWVLLLIQELDYVPTQYLKKLVNTDDIWEVRVQFGNNTFRLLGFFDNEDLIILTNGFAKKTQKTPSQEIDLAENRKQDYLNKKEIEKNNE